MVGEWWNTKEAGKIDIQGKLEAKIDRRQGGRGKKEQETKSEILKSDNRQHMQVENIRILISAEMDDI